MSRVRWPSHSLLLGKAARASYGTYLIHVALAPEIKFVLVTIAAVAACYLAGTHSGARISSALTKTFTKSS